MLRRLKELGIRVAIDDFGTGYSSLAYLKRFPIDSVKVDRSFVQDIPEDVNSMAIAQAVIAMAHSLRLRVVAEGVESEAQLAFLRGEGCDEIQGRYFSEPRAASEISGDHAQDLAAQQRRLPFGASSQGIGLGLGLCILVGPPSAFQPVLHPT